MKFFIGVIGFLLSNSLYSFQEIIKVEVNELKTLNLSQIATSLEPIILEVPPKMEDRFFTNIALNEDYIFALTLSENMPANSRLLQFKRSGKFVREIGEMTEGWNSLFFDSKNQIIGVNNGQKIFQYNYQGKLFGEVKAIGRDQIVHRDRHYAVSINFPALGEPIDYNLVQTNEAGEEEKLLIEFQDNSTFTVGQHMRFSKHGADLLLWNNIDHTFILIKDGYTQVKYRLKLDKGLKTRANSMIIGDWLILPSQRTKQNIIKLINLKSGESFETLDRYDIGIIDDMANNGFVKLHETAIYGDIENKIFFLKNASDIENIKNDYPPGFKVLLIATLK